MYCKECGTENQDNSLKCKSCGAFLRLLDAPLNGGDRIKIVSFFLLLAVTLTVGIIPILIALSGIYIMKKDKSFTPITNSKKYIKAYLIVLAFGAAILTTAVYYNEKEYIYNYEKYDTSEYKTYNKNIKAETAMVAVAGLILVPIPVALFIWLFNSLYFRPLEEHRDWITQNGIFSDKKEGNENSTGIIGRDKLSSFSIADEMLKWNDLLEKGLISKEEFDKAKQKLLNEEKVS